MVWAAAFVLAALDLLGAAELRHLGEADDARALPYLERALETRLHERERFPGSLAPPDLDEEIVAALLALERLERERALFWARAISAAQPGRLDRPDRELLLAARRVLARSGDRRVVATALRRYFDEPIVWHSILASAAAATVDVRLRDFSDPSERREPPSDALFRSRLAHALGETIEPPSGPPLELLIAGDSLQIQQTVLALPSSLRDRAIRLLAAQDHVALIGLPMTTATLDRFYPYLALSRHRPLRERLHRAQSARGRALACLLLSPQVGPEERRIHADAMREGWLDAIAVLGEDAITPIVGEASVVSLIEASAPHEGMVSVRSPEARVRLEQAATPDAIRWLGRRADAVLSMPALAALRGSANEEVRAAAELELLRMGAPGAGAYLRDAIQSESLGGVLAAAVASTVDVDLVQRAVERVARRAGPQPEALIAMHRFQQRYPREFLVWLEADDVRLRQRAHFAMALSADARRLPLLIELAVAGRGASRDAALGGLSEADLGNLDKRLHRLAGAPEREVRFQTAVALVPTGEEWAFRLLVAELDEARASERLRVRRAVERLPQDVARARLWTLVSDQTASPFAVELYWDLEHNRDALGTRDAVWRVLAPFVALDDAIALLGAARLGQPEARAAVEHFLGAR